MANNPNNVDVNVNVNVNNLNGLTRVQQNLLLLSNNLQSQVNPNLRQTSTNLNQVNNSATSATPTISNLTNEMKTGFNAANLSIMGVSLALSVMGKDLSKVAADFDREMRNINSIAQESEDSFTRLAGKIRILSNDPKIKDAPALLAKGMYTLVSSGFDAEQALDRVAIASKGASAGLTTTEVSVKALSGLMNAYNQKTLKDASEFSDQLFKVVDKGNLSFEQLAENLGNVLAVSAPLGIEFNQVGAAFIELTKNSVNASEAQTAISNLIRVLSTPTPEVLKFAESIGALDSIGEVAIKTKGLNGVLKELYQITNGSTTLMRKFTVEATATNAALILGKNGGEGFTQSLKDMSNAAGATDRALSQQAKSSAFQLEKMKNAVEDLKIEYGALLNEGIAPVIDIIKYFIDYVKNLDTETKKTIVNTGLWVVALGSALLAINGLIAALGLLASSPFFVKSLALVAIFEGLNLVVTELTKSTDAWANSLGQVLKYWDLINLAKEGIKTIAAFQQNNTEEKDKQKIIDEYNSGHNSFKQKEAKSIRDKTKLSIDDYQKELQRLIAYQTYAESKQEFAYISSETKRIKTIIDSTNKEQTIIKESEKQKSIEIGKQAQIRLKKIEEEMKKKEEFDRKTKELQKEFHDFYKKIENDISQSTKSRFEYSKILLLEEKNDRIAKLNEMKKHHIDIKDAEKLTEKAYAEELKKLNKEQKEKELEDLEDTKKRQRELKDFIADINKKASDLNVSEAQKEKNAIKDTLREVYKSYEDQKEKMASAKDINGNKKFSVADISDFTNQFSLAYKNYEKQLNDNLKKHSTAKEYEIQIEEIKQKLQDFGLEEDVLRGDKLEKEKEFWIEIKNTAQTALLDKSKLTEEDYNKFKKQDSESSKELKRNLQAKETLAKEGLKNIAKLTEEVITSFDILNKESVQAFTSMISFEKGVIQLSKPLSDALDSLSKGGLQGLIDFAKNGGDLSGILALFNFIKIQITGMVHAFTDNLKNPKNFEDFVDIFNNIAEDFINTLSLGATKAIKNGALNLLGIPSKTEIDAAKKNMESIGQSIFNTIQEQRKTLVDLEMKLSTDKISEINKWYKIELDTIKDSTDNYEIKNNKIALLDKELFDKKASYYLELSRIEHKNQELNDDDATKALKKAQDDLAELEITQQDHNLKEQKRIEIIQTLNDNLTKIKEDYFTNIGNLMSKYYDKELNNIKANHKAEYDLIRVNENKIKDNQIKIDSLNSELDKINKEFDKRLLDTNLSAEASKNFADARKALISKNNGIDLNALIRTPPDELERQIKAKKEQIDLDFQQTGNVQQRADALKELAVEQNIFWSELAKTLTKGTKEYDQYIQNANDGFRDYKAATRDSLQAQKENSLQTKEVTSQIENLTNENKKLENQVNSANLTVNNDIDSLTSKFKTSTGEWITDINKARLALQGISSDSQSAIASLNRIQSGNQTANNINTSTVQPTNVSTTIKPSSVALAKFADALPNETMDQYIARVTKQDALAEQARIASLTNRTVPSGQTITGVANFSNSTPTPVSTNFASGSVTSAGTTGLFDKGGGLGWINPMNWFAEGGIATGSQNGYPAVLHGREAIINQKQGDNLAYIMKMANTRPSYSNNSSVNITPNIIINGSGLGEKELTRAITNVFDNMGKRARMGY